ncbi:hypothetical protein HDU67_000191 [Dinochytrium kinnereticum]|nr:hypothetical protein HDU67_000191 [Dinochytrium kinnereticum]
MLTVPVVERSFTTFRGLRLSAKAWGIEGKGQPMLALHGWLDNAGTWDLLLPTLLERHPDEYYVVCLDIAGHGFSDHRSLDSNYILPSYIEDMVSVVDFLGWDTFKILGHSMGSVIGIMAAGVLKERVTGVISVESFGPYAIPTQDVEDTSNYISHRQSRARRAEPTKKSVFSTLQAAVRVRMDGFHKLSELATWPLVIRGVVPVDALDSAKPFTNSLIGAPTVSLYHAHAASAVAAASLDSLPPSVALSITTPPEPTVNAEQTPTKAHLPVAVPKYWTWSSDARVREPALMWYHEPAVETFLRRITCPVLVIWGDEGLRHGFNVPSRSKCFDPELLTVVEFPGGHHLHLEPETLGRCVDAISEFLSSDAVRAGAGVVDLGGGTLVAAKL